MELIESALNWETGRTFSTSMREMFEPVTDTASSLMTSSPGAGVFSAAAGAAGGTAWANSEAVARTAITGSRARRFRAALVGLVGIMVGSLGRGSGRSRFAAAREYGVTVTCSQKGRFQ